MHRFYCPHLAPLAVSGVAGALAELDRDESHHAAKVLRLAVGEQVDLLDGAGLTARGVIESLKPVVTVRVTETTRHAPPRPAIEVATAIPKGPRADAMIEQLSQLGCDRLIPLRTQRSVVDPRDAKLDRFARAALESAKQCGRAHLMTIEGTMDLDAALVRGPHDVRLIASPGAGPLAEIADSLRGAARILVLIGPEGGFSPEEAKTAREAGAIACSLGPHVLRIETAAVAAVAALRALLAR